MRSAVRSPRRDRLVDFTCVTLSLLGTFAMLLDAWDDPGFSRPYLVSGLVLSVAGSLALWRRRERPLLVALLILPVGMYTEMAFGAVLVSMFSLAVHRPWRFAVALTAAHAAGSVPYAVLRPDPELSAGGYGGVGLATFAVVLTILISVPFVAWGMVVRARRELVGSLRERAERAEAEAALRADRIRGREREHIAREMHDALAHRITLVSLHAGALEIRPDMRPDEVAHVAGTIRSSAHQALEDLREILGVLRSGEAVAEGAQPPPATRPQPGVADIAELVGESRAAGASVALVDRLPEAAGSLPASVGRTAYRVVQEGLTNARKHAPGHGARVLLDRTGEGELHVRVDNPLTTGQARPALPGARSGLVGLSERVSLAGGRIDYGARRGEAGAIDFRLEAWLPWPT
ncbi:sensor histidine kinase [Streptomyces hainanensis]|uniref:histidine kinase n=1 Tax=Streptomyces hainanensis TaxID=402648 RepID=A0A4R4T9W5_9ACTN|nr:histidine kinase [Streptomyces hainanensis]TDC72786.1 sensor histidine kinase [Streptomyces hainanensis]